VIEVATDRAAAQWESYDGIKYKSFVEARSKAHKLATSETEFIESNPSFNKQLFGFRVQEVAVQTTTETISEFLIN
jgi:hypothetical protein